MSDKITKFDEVMRHGCPELEHVGDSIEKLETEWAERFTATSNVLAQSANIHKTAFHIAKQALVQQVRTHRAPNGQLWDMQHPVWETYNCGTVYFDMTEHGAELIEMQTVTIQGLRNFDYFTEAQDTDYSGNVLSFFQLELMDGDEAVVRLEDRKLEAVTDKGIQPAALGSLLTTLSFVKLKYC